MEIDIFMTLTIAVLALMVGSWLRRRIPALKRFCIPAPVIGGLVFALISLAGYVSGAFVCKFNEDIKELCMVLFFTSVGFQANLKTIKQGGKPLIVLIILVALTSVLENLAAIGSAWAMGLDGMVGMTAGSIPMLGGHGTAGAFGPDMEALGLRGATTLCTAAATFGLIAGSLIGGPLGEHLIVKRNLLSTAVPEADDTINGADRQHLFTSCTTATFQLILAAGIGTLLSWAISLTGITFPIYIGGMLVAAIMRNYAEYTHRLEIPMHQINDLGNICLSLFLGMAMISLRLWELAELALPLVVMLAVQFILVVLLARFVVFRFLGGNYDAAVMTSGYCGFAMGATPNAIANMQAVCDRFAPSAKAYLLIPLVGSMFADFINSFIITFFINIL